ncbi:MAG: diguanylate cyclase, partial [Thermoflavifilum sp.]|nr:diguanylate cyclase [Thermoflavifilum sp.]MCL6515160.1 diguanylate cyclase [Alicyclobacillus sp.]
RDAGLAGAILFTGLILLVAHFFQDYFKMANHFKELAIRDELTGLHNHRHIHNVMDELIAAQRPFALLMVDIDNFRKYNDLVGHIKGDEVLQKLATTLQGHCEGEESIARYSGEEFAVVLPDADLEQAQHKAELMRKSVEAMQVEHADQLPGKKFTISVGVATYPEMASTKKELLMKVDDALYKGKLTGRNKVSIYYSLLDELHLEPGMDEKDAELINTIKVFLAILNSKDRYTYAHTERNVMYVDAMGKRLGMTEEERRYLRFGAFLHDIGKVEIPLEILAKRGPLSREEWAIMKTHVIIGENIVRPISGLQRVLPMIRHHHERYDGTGYPDGLAGEDIPLEVRILTLADSFDAMTTSRPYQRKRSMEQAFRELRRCAGSQFDPNLVEIFISVVEDMGILQSGSADEDDEDSLA